MTTERLSALDASFLAVESEAAPMHVGWVSTFAPPEDGPRAGFDELFEFLAGRLAHAPRWRQKLAPVPLGLTSRRGSTTRTSIPPSTSCTRRRRPRRDRRRDLLRAAAARPPAVAVLDRRRAARRQLAMICKAHHCMVDGIAIAELGKLILDAEPFEDRARGRRVGAGARAVARRALRPRRRRPRRRRRLARARAAQARDLARAAARRARASRARSRTRCSRRRPARRSTAPARRTAATCA